MTETPDQWNAEVHVSEDGDTGENFILLMIFKNKEHVESYILDSLRGVKLLDTKSCIVRRMPCAEAEQKTAFRSTPEL